MLYQISSGMGPIECSIAVYNMYHYLQDNYDDITLSYINHDKRDLNAYKSCIIDTESNLDEYIGTIEWICPSTVRPNHKRKNWFINITKLSEVKIEDTKDIESNIIFTTTHSGGPGGQNVNKVETGVIAQYKDIVVKSTEQRSQFANKNSCIKKIYAIINQMNNNARANSANEAWQDHNNLVRGNPVKVFKGKKFIEVG